MDSLGGMLTNGLLGNMILGRFNLFFDILIEDITPTPSTTPSYSSTPLPSVTVPSPTPTITITPTPQPTPVFAGHGGGIGYSGKLDPDDRLVKITIIYKKQEYVSVQRVNSKTLRISINILKGMTYLKQATLSIAVKIRERFNNIKVKINGNGNRN